MQLGRKINTKLTAALFDLPDGGGSLAFRNLLRGQALGLPSGQDVAKRLRIQDVLTEADLDGAPEPTPLWFYIVKESEKRADGMHLGDVGGRIVGEVLAGLLEADQQSWFSVDPDWTPTVPVSDSGRGLQLVDLVSFATVP